MKKATTTLLKIIDCTQGHWKYDLKTGLSDDEIRALLAHLRYIENTLHQQLKTEIVHLTDTIAFIQQKKHT
ncbi:MAG: hypothetical protein JXA00_04855 [Candidatus Thermoplasmatota archaeon]|nr:hypothetical protein [Candidatus Thermoplasmatota archaeon]